MNYKRGTRGGKREKFTEGAGFEADGVGDDALVVFGAGVLDLPTACAAESPTLRIMNFAISSRKF